MDLERETDTADTHPALADRLNALGVEPEQASALGLERPERSAAEAILPACQLAHGYLVEHDREQGAERYLERARAYGERLDAAEAERNTLGKHERFVPHGLDAQTVERIRRIMSEDREVKRAYLVRRVMQHLDAERPAYLIVVRQRTVWFGGSDPDEVVSRLLAQVQVPGALYLATSPFWSLRLRRRVARVEGSKIYR